VGTSCANGLCDGSGPPFGTGDPPCQFVALDPCQDTPFSECQKPITVGCTTTASTNVTILPFNLVADPGPILSGAPVTIDYTGLALFEKTPFLDAGLGLFPGLTRASLTALNATTEVRTGLTGPNALLNADTSGLEIECSISGAPCTVDTDCPGVMFDEFCGAFADLPASWFCDNNSTNIGDGSGDPGGGQGICDNVNRLCTVNADCGAGGTCLPNCDDACLTGGVCDNLGGVALTQCSANGYCLIGDLPLPLNTVIGAPYTADIVGSSADGLAAVKIGWWGTGVLPIEGDGTYLMPVGTAQVTPVPEIAIQVVAGAAAVPIQCWQAVASDGPDGTTPPVLADASPTPDSALIPFNIQLP
jgi:hypothetical protein